jgi:hypothetical protein
LNLVGDTARDIEAPPSDDEGSPESYIGYDLAERFSSLEKLDHDKQRIYSLPDALRLTWIFSESWISFSSDSIVFSLWLAAGGRTGRHRSNAHIFNAPRPYWWMVQREPQAG